MLRATMNFNALPNLSTDFVIESRRMGIIANAGQKSILHVIRPSS